MLVFGVNGTLCFALNKSMLSQSLMLRVFNITSSEKLHPEQMKDFKFFLCVPVKTFLCFVVWKMD